MGCGGRGARCGRRRRRVGWRWRGLHLLRIWHRAHSWHFEAGLHRRCLGRLTRFAQPLFWRGVRLVRGRTGILRRRGCSCRGGFARRRCGSRRRCRGRATDSRFGLPCIGYLGDRWWRRRRRWCRYRRKARTQFLIAVFRIGAVGDQALRQLLPLGLSQCPVGRWRHRREVRIIGGLPGREIFSIRCRFRIGVVLAGTRPITPSVDRIACGEPEHHRQNGEPARQAPGERGCAHHHDCILDQAAGCGASAFPCSRHTFSRRWCIRSATARHYI